MGAGGRLGAVHEIVREWRRHGMAQRPHQPAFDEIVVHQRSPGESDAEPVDGRFDRQVRIAEARSIEPLHPEAGAPEPVLPGAAAAILLGAGIVQQHMEEVIGVSDRVAVMCEGAISGFLERSRFSEQNILQLAVGNRLQVA